MNYKKLKIPETSSWDKNHSWWFKNISYPLYNKYRYTWWYKFYQNKIKFPIKDFKKGIKNIFKWLPTIWKDRDWDHFYIFEIIKKKLEYQRKYLVENNRFVGVEQVNRDITICLNLINKLKEDYYELEYQDYYIMNDNLFGTLSKEKNKDGNYIWKSEILEESFDKFFKKHKSAYRKMMKRNSIIRKKWNNFKNKKTQALALSDYNHERAKTLLFKILNEKIEYWWD